MLDSQPVKSNPKVSLVVASILAVWFALIMVLGADKMFVSTPGTPPLPIFFGAVLPIVFFFAAYLLQPSFRDFIMTLDLRLATGIQAWRAGGLGFLALYVHGILPGAFAWPAGLGDIAIGVTAPWLVLALIRHPILRPVSYSSSGIFWEF